MIISQKDFISFCIKKDLLAKEQFVQMMHYSESSCHGNKYLALYKKVYAFLADTIDFDWHSFDKFLARHPDCQEKINILKQIYESFDFVQTDNSTERSKKTKSFCYDITKHVTIRIRPTIHLFLNGQKHLIHLNMSKTSYSKKKIVYAMNLIGLAQSSSDPNVHFSYWDCSKPEGNRHFSIDTLDPHVVQFLKDKAEELYQLDQQIPDIYKFPESDNGQDMAA